MVTVDDTSATRAVRGLRSSHGVVQMLGTCQMRGPPRKYAWRAAMVRMCVEPVSYEVSADACGIE